MTDKKRNFLDKAVDVFFNKTKLSLLMIFIFGFIIRLIAARNIGVSADDVNHAIIPIGIFNSGKLAIWHQSNSLWYYIQGVFYNFFGIGQIASRFSAVLFGSLLIILVFVFVKKVFRSERVALISSFLIAISPMLIKGTLPEMDVGVSFFILFSAYFLFSYFDSKSNKHLILSGLFMGVGIMIKLYALFFAMSFLVFFLYKEFKSERQLKKTFKRFLLFGMIISILVIPTLAHNYLLYSDAGFMDFIFSNTLNVGGDKANELYGWAAGWGLSPDYRGFFLGNQQNFDPTPLPGFLIVLGFLFKGDPLLFILGFSGLIMAFKTNRDYFWFFIITFIPVFIYLGAFIPLSKHFIWGLVLMAPLAGSFTSRILLGKIKIIKLRYLFLVFLIFSLLYLGMPKGVTHSHFYGESSFGQLIDFKENEISDNALVVVDSRIYRGNMHWGLTGTNYVEVNLFFNLVQQLEPLEGKQNIEVYYVECVVDDCGWGTVVDQPEFNATMEEATKIFADASYFKEDFEAPRIDEYYLPFIGEKEVRYRIYKADLSLPPSILQVVRQTHVWFLYPIGYDRTISEIFDDYEVRGPLDNSISIIAWIILYFELIFAFFAIIYILYLFLDN